jgi:hypothetical protein
MDRICFLICYPSDTLASNGRGTHSFAPTTVRSWSEVVKRVAISHKHNVMIVVKYPNDRKMTKNKIINRRFHCLEQNMQATETYCILNML